jgi:hypothetical protein
MCRAFVKSLPCEEYRSISRGIHSNHLSLSTMSYICMPYISPVTLSAPLPSLPAIGSRPGTLKTNEPEVHGWEAYVSTDVGLSSDFGLPLRSTSSTPDNLLHHLSWFPETMDLDSISDFIFLTLSAVPTSYASTLVIEISAVSSEVVRMLQSPSTRRKRTLVPCS